MVLASRGEKQESEMASAAAMVFVCAAAEEYVYGEGELPGAAEDEDGDSTGEVRAEPGLGLKLG